MPFFSQLSYGGMARMKGFGGNPRSLTKEVYVNFQGSQWTYDNMPSSQYTSNAVFYIQGDSNAQADLRFTVASDNGYVTANMVVTVGDTYTYQRQGQGNNSYTCSSLVCGSVPNSIPSYAPRMIAMGGVHAPNSCQWGGAAGYPQGQQGGGMRSCGQRLGWGANPGGGGCGGTTWGYLSGSGGQRGAYYPGPGADAYDGGFMNYGNGGTFWFTEWSGRSPGGFGYYGGGGGGGGWAPNYGCPGGGGGGSNYAGGLPSGAPTPGISANSVSLYNVSSGSDGSSSSYIRFDQMLPL
jgi:hypothetical protein